MNYKEQFLNDGFLIFRNNIPSDICKEVILSFREYEKSHDKHLNKYKDQNGHYPRILNFHTYSNAAKKVFSRNSALILADSILGAETALYASLFFESGSEQSLHRDSPYFNTRPENQFLGMWTALEPTNELNGTLLVVPGSHKIDLKNEVEIAKRFYPNLDLIPSVDERLWDAYQASIENACQKIGLKSQILTFDTGDTILMSPLLLHGAINIKDKSATRFSIIFHMVAKGLPAYQADMFFNPSKMPEEIKLEYDNFEGRSILHLDNPILKIGNPS